MKPVRRMWTKEENEILRKRYSEGYEVLSRVLGRTVEAVRGHASVMGISPKINVWTAADDAKLRLLFGTRPIPEVAAILKRSALAASHRAREIGIRLPEMSRGYDCVTSAAKRHGLDPITVKLIVRWAKVHATRISFEFKSSGSGSGRGMFYDSDSIDEAIEKWRNSESMEAASRRTGWSTTTIARWLLSAGVKPNKRHNRRGGRWYVSREDVDRVVADRSKPESIVNASRRYGVHHTTMRAMLVIAGLIEHGASLQRKLDPDDVDRAVADYRRLETVEDAAARHGVSAFVMRKWLTRAGVKTGASAWSRKGDAQKSVGKFKWRLEPADVDRVMAERSAKLPREAA